MNVMILLEGVLLGGGERDILRLTGELQARGHRVVIACAGDAMEQAAREADYTVVRIPTNRAGFAGIGPLARAVAEHEIEVLNAHSIRMTLVAGLAKKLGRVKAPLLTTIHNVHDRGNDRVAFPILEYGPELLVFISHFERARLGTAWGREIGSVIPTGIELPALAAVEPMDLTRVHGVPEGARVVGYVGRLSPEKGIEDALAMLAELGRDTWLCLVGEGPEEDALRAEADRLGVGERTVFVGFSREPLRYMRAFDVLVLTSRRESLPVVLREAASVERPVVSADVGGVAEIVVHGVTGILYPSGDVAALTESVRQLLSDPERATAMGRAGRQRIEERFSVGRWVDETEALYAKLIEQWEKR